MHLILRKAEVETWDSRKMTWVQILCANYLAFVFLCLLLQDMRWCHDLIVAVKMECTSICQEHRAVPDRQ